MRRRSFLMASGAGALLPMWSQGEVTPERRKRTLVFRTAAPVATSSFMIQTRVPSTLLFEDAPLPLLPVRMVWAREGQVAEEGFQMKNVRIVNLPENGNWLKELSFANLPAMVFKNFAEARIHLFQYRGADYQAWLRPWKDPDGPCGLLRCPATVAWTWALITCEAEEVRACFTRKVTVTDPQKGDVQASGDVVTFGNDGFALADAAKVTLLPDTVFASLDEKGDITSVRRLKREDMLAEMDRQAAK